MESIQIDYPKVGYMLLACYISYTHIWNSFMLFPICFLLVNSLYILSDYAKSHSSDNNIFLSPFKWWNWIISLLQLSSKNDDEPTNESVKSKKPTLYRNILDVIYYVDIALSKYSVYMSIKNKVNNIKHQFITILLIILDAMILQLTQTAQKLITRVILPQLGRGGGSMGMMSMMMTSSMGSIGNPALNTSSIRYRAVHGQLNGGPIDNNLLENSDSESEDEQENGPIIEPVD